VNFETSEPLRPQTGPVPHASSQVSVPFWQGCEAEELRYQRCAVCRLRRIAANAFRPNCTGLWRVVLARYIAGRWCTAR
jgi:hypothetical protein